MAVRLEPVGPGHLADLRRLELEGVTGSAGRFAGAVPSPAAYAEALWSGVLAQRAVVVDGTVHGLVSAYDHDPRSGTAWLAAWGDHRHLGTGSVAGGALRFVEWVFAAWPLRWLYAETTSANLERFSSALDGWATEVARLPGRHRRGGVLVDGVVLACDRATVDAAIRPRLHAAERAAPAAPHAAPEVVLAGIGELLGRPTAGWRPADRLVDELGLDSLELFLVALWLGERWGVELDADALAGASAVDLAAATRPDPR